jgi:siroheme synthase
LIAAGLSADTPAAGIENGTTQHQRRCITTLQELPDRIVESGFQAPVMIVIGGVVELSSILDWFMVDGHDAGDCSDDGKSQSA